MKLNTKEIRKLIKIAEKTRECAFAHRSNHKVGASVLTMDGQIFGGCNVEAVISGLGTCAERCAIDHAIAHGCYDIKAVCTIDKQLTPTCGACLQYIMLFSQVTGEDIYIITADLDGNYEINMLSNLLPEGYRTQRNLELIRSFSNLQMKHLKSKTTKDIKKKK